MSLYSLDLANLETSQPDLQNILTEGGFGVNRTGKSFASVPLDMALKQTINANAESRLKGIMVFADISTAENRWIVTASMKSNILNAVLDCADMSISCDESKELRASRIRVEQNHLSKLNKVIKVMLYPFSKQPNKDFLFNIKTGTQASKDVEKYLLTLLKCGNERDVFASECSSTSERFIKSIRKTRITTFPSENFERNKSVLHTHMEQFNKMISQQFFTIRLNIFQSNPPDNMEIAIVDGMFILTLSRRRYMST